MSSSYWLGLWPDETRLLYALLTAAAESYRTRAAAERAASRRREDPVLAESAASSEARAARYQAIADRLQKEVPGVEEEEG